MNIYTNALKKNLIYEIHPSCIGVHPGNVLVDAAIGKTLERAEARTKKVEPIW